MPESSPLAPLPEPRLDRRKQFDERSRSFGIRPLLAAADTPRKPRSYTWRCLRNLDQQAEGACVGFSFAHELIARPGEVPGITAAEARAIYKHAQTLDPWDGDNYSGTSVLAGVKAVQALYPGKYGSYRWAFGMHDCLLALSYIGPVVLGIDWYTGMFNTDNNGFIEPTGNLAGGHAILCNGINVREEYVTLTNSWGKQWGTNGSCKISYAGLDALLMAQGEVCVPLSRAAEKRLGVTPSATV